MSVPSPTLMVAFQLSRHFQARFFLRPFLVGWVWGPDYAKPTPRLVPRPPCPAFVACSRRSGEGLDGFIT